MAQIKSTPIYDGSAVVVATTSTLINADNLSITAGGPYTTHQALRLTLSDLKVGEILQVQASCRMTFDPAWDTNVMAAGWVTLLPNITDHNPGSTSDDQGIKLCNLGGENFTDPQSSGILTRSCDIVIATAAATKYLCFVVYFATGDYPGGWTVDLTAGRMSCVRITP